MFGHALQTLSMALTTQDKSFISKAGGIRLRLGFCGTETSCLVRSFVLYPCTVDPGPFDVEPRVRDLMPCAVFTM